MREDKFYMTLNREVFQSGLFKSGKHGTFKVFMRLLGWATVEANGCEAVFDNKQIIIKKGQIITSQEKLQQACGLCRNSVKDSLQWLHEYDYIDVQTCKDPLSGTLITILRTFGVNEAGKTEKTEKPDKTNQPDPSKHGQNLTKLWSSEVPSSGQVGDQVTSQVRCQVGGQAPGYIKECLNDKNEENGMNVCNVPRAADAYSGNSNSTDINQSSESLENTENTEIPETSSEPRILEGSETSVKNPEENIAAEHNEAERSEAIPNPPDIPPPPLPLNLQNILDSPISDSGSLLETWERLMEAMGFTPPDRNSLDDKTAKRLLQMVGVTNIGLVIKEYVRDKFVQKKTNTLTLRHVEKDAIYIRNVITYFQDRHDALRLLIAAHEKVIQEKKMIAEQQRQAKLELERLERKKEKYLETVERLKEICQDKYDSAYDYRHGFYKAYDCIQTGSIQPNNKLIDYLNTQYKNGIKMGGLIKQFIAIDKEDYRISMSQEPKPPELPKPPEPTEPAEPPEPATPTESPNPADPSTTTSEA